MPDRILLVDADSATLDVLGLGLESAGFEVDKQTNVAGALAALEAEPIALVVTDLDLAGESGLDLTNRLHELRPELPVIIMTGYGSVSSAVEAMRAGVWDYLTKPVSLDELELHARRAIEHTRLTREVETLRRAVSSQGAEGFDLVGVSPAVVELRELVQRVAGTEVGVLLIGESGTGKEVVAQAIQKKSARAGHAFVPVNCAALPENLLESELFGHVRGTRDVVQIDLPPLRARGNDVLILAQSFIERFAQRHQVNVRGLTPEAAEKLLQHSWPGNVRELMNAIERAVALARGELLALADLPERVRDAEKVRIDVTSDDPEELLTLEELERRYIARVLETTAGNRTQAARILGVDRKTLFRKLKRADSEAEEAHLDGETASSTSPERP